MSRKLNIVFMGTPDFAVASLDAILHRSEHNVVAVITAPDKKAGRGKKIQSSAVKDYAFKHNLLILQPTNLKDPEFIERVKRLKADINVVVAFRMLPEAIWDMPVYGTFNLHASLLPQYRGAAPINHAIINGEQKSGITTFFLDKEIDTGKIILQEEVHIASTDDAGVLHDNLMSKGSSLVVKTLDMIAAGGVSGQAQSDFISEDTILKSAPKIFKHHCQVDWNLEGESIRNQIRGLSPYPTAYTLLCNPEGKEHYIKVFKARFEAMENTLAGRVRTQGGKSLSIECANGILHISDLQLQGKKRMLTEDFLRGFSISDDWFAQSPASLA
jgi:methionyl-tRNA formyltransferase